MIEPNELRIGNWFYIHCYELDPWEYGLTETEIELHHFCGFENYQFEPIPLTPEILERAGFGCRAGNVYYKEGVVDSLIYQYDGFIVWEVNNMVIKYLHWLQNLYFCLTTGKELEINDPVTKYL
jgi:hypothetical protein